MSKVQEAAWAAQRAEEERQAKEKQKVAKAAADQARKERQARVRKHKHLLEKSVLPRIFPDAEWVIEDVLLGETPRLLVKEKGGDITFRVTPSETYIQYESRTYDYSGYPRTQDARIKVESALDVGRYLKIMSDQLDESYRRHPD